MHHAVKEADSACGRRPVGRPPIEIELVLPSQFLAPRSEGCWSGEKRLMLALLTDAIAILEKGRGATGSRRREIFEETSAWLARDDVQWPCSFVSICDALCLDVASVRRMLTRRVKEARERATQAADDRVIDPPASAACSST